MVDVQVAAVRSKRQGGGFTTRWMTIGMAVVALTCVASPAQAQVHHGGGHAARGGAPHMMMFGGSPEQVGRVVDRMLDGLNATDAQRSQIKQVAIEAGADLKAQREAGRGLRAQGMQLFAAPNVDAVAAESIRQQMSAQHDQASKRTLQAMLEVAKVLTPEQRGRLGERIAQHDAAMKERTQRMHHQRSTTGAGGALQPAPQR